MKKISIPIIIILSLFVIMPFKNVNATNVNGERIDWNQKMKSGRDIAYWIDENCQYTTSIPNAAQKLMYPDSGSNPMILSYTDVNNYSKMDFYQIYDSNEDAVAYTQSFRRNDSGNYYAMSVTQKDTYEWIYVEITLNDYYMDSMTSVKREAIIIHEMLHGYGLKDLYLAANNSSIMYGYSNGTATGVTADANSVLNAKYPKEA